MTTREEQRIKTEKAASDYLTEDGVKLNFGDTANVRDCLEQVAAKLESNPLQKKAVSDYLAALQQPDIKPEQLVYETNKLSQAFPFHPNSLNNAADVLLVSDMTKIAEGVAAHNDIVGLEAYTTNKFDRTLLRAVDAVVDEFEKAKNYIAGKFAPPTSGPK